MPATTDLCDANEAKLADGTLRVLALLVLVLVPCVLLPAAGWSTFVRCPG